MSASSSQIVSPGGSASPTSANRTDQIVHRVYLKTVGILVDGRLTHSGGGREDKDKERKKDKWVGLLP
jgi:autophagy-related protein 13